MFSSNLNNNIKSSERKILPTGGLTWYITKVNTFNVSFCWNFSRAVIAILL